MWFLETWPLVFEREALWSTSFILATFYRCSCDSRISTLHKTFQVETFHFPKWNEILKLLSIESCFMVNEPKIRSDVEHQVSFLHIMYYKFLATQSFNHFTIRSVFSSWCPTLSFWRIIMMSSLYDSWASESTTCIISASLFSLIFCNEYPLARQH